MIPAWFRIEEGFRATTKQPYMELEVLPVANGWRWTVESMSPRLGSCERRPRFLIYAGRWPSISEISLSH
jgi:hypothetical protein